MRPLETKAVALSSIILFLFFIQSCQTKNPLNSQIKPLEGTIIFNIAEGLPDEELVGTPRMMLSLRTEKIYGCINYKIATEVSRSRTDILVFLSHVYIGDVCFTALGPARAQIPLDLTDGVYSLTISNRDFDDRYEVAVSGSSIAIIEKESHFTTPEQER